MIGEVPLVNVKLGMLPAPSAEKTELYGGARTCSMPRWFAIPQAVKRAVATVGEHRELRRDIPSGAQFLGHPVGHLLVCLGLDQLGDSDRIEVEVVMRSSSSIANSARRRVQRDPAARVAPRDQGSREADPHR